MILHCDDPAVPVLRQLGEPLILLSVNPTAENIAQMICDVAVTKVFHVVEVRLWETAQCCATYCPDRPPADRIRVVEVSVTGRGATAGDNPQSREPAAGDSLDP